MRLPCKGKNVIDEEVSDALVDYAIRHGVNYFDTAYFYIGGQSQVYTGKVLEKYDRKKLFIVNKMPGVRNLDEAKGVFKKQLEACRTTYFDNYLLHAIGDYKRYEAQYLKGGVLDYLKGEREAGRIKHLGFSFHGNEDALRRFLGQKDAGWEFVMLQMSADGEGRNFYDIVKETNLPIFAMEPLHAGRLANLNVAARAALKELKPGLSPAGWALRWATSQPNVVLALSGMAKMSDVVDNCNTFRDYQPLTAAEQASYHAISEKYKDAKNLLPCTGCAYCEPCFYGVDIPGVFGLVNSCRTDGLLGSDGNGAGMTAEQRQKFLALYDAKLSPKASAARCHHCGACHPKCPQHINISQELKKINGMVKAMRTA